MELYPWLVFLHIAGAFLFVMAHGVSAVVAFRLRAERDAGRMTALLDLSATSVGVMYIGLLVLLVAGVIAAINRNWFSQGWPWAAIIVLVVVAAAMYLMASRYYSEIRTALGLPSMNVKEPPPPRPVEEVVRLLDTKRPEQIAAVGFAGLLVILWLMILKPF